MIVRSNRGELRCSTLRAATRSLRRMATIAKLVLRQDGADLILTLTLADQLEEDDPHPPVQVVLTPPASIATIRKNPLTIRAESKHGVIIDHIRFHLAQGIVIDGFDIFPESILSRRVRQEIELASQWNSRRQCLRAGRVLQSRKDKRSAGWLYRRLVRPRPLDQLHHYSQLQSPLRMPAGGCTPSYDPLQDDDRLYLIKFNQSHHITIEDNELFDGKNYQRKPAIDLPCVDDVIVRRNLIRNCHRGVVSKGGGSRVLIEANVFVDNSGAAFSGGSTDPDLFIDGRYGDPCSFAKYESYDMTARNNLVVSTRPGERPVEPISIWAAKNAPIENNTFVGIGERGVLLIRPGNEVDSPAKGCGRSVRLTQTENLTLQKQHLHSLRRGRRDDALPGDRRRREGQWLRSSRQHFLQWGRDVPVGGFADPNQEPGFSKD